MLDFERFVLDNGLRVIVHEDHSTPLAVVNVLYDVGARDEHPEMTGLAHLVEHLMFSGSANIPVYDEPLQMAGGENNAFTTNDLTNYYISLPAENIETAFWLESDRMLSLAFTQKGLDVQKKVVVEEFNEHYINKPYGNVWKLVRELAFTTHPYKWMTIGREPGHIEKVELDDVKQFFFKHYRPINTILVVAGKVKMDDIRLLAEKWFGGIPSGEKYKRSLPVEPVQAGARFREVVENVPVDELVKVWHIGDRLSKHYHTTDLITEILGGGESSRLYQRLVKEKQIFASISCFHFGSIENGMLAIDGKIVKGVDIKEADAAVGEEIERLKGEAIGSKELEKLKNITESNHVFENIGVLNRATNLAFFELLGDASMANQELEKYWSVTVEDIQTVANEIFRENNSNTLYYRSNS